ncbi:cupin [Phytomonospora sp. NPDC050363]|uniref:cupin domain-containing protein n=1 Tax=Phytomonospora sp. NPDC050363 TaxID=3155642 RepID=UPI0033DE2AFB
MSWFPGGTSVSRVTVYDWSTVDGMAGGSPHLHTASAEGYVVVGGEGAVETLDSTGFASHSLTRERILWFTPGTVHRLVNHGGLEILVVMSNAGLPEAGDAVMTYPPEILADPEAYAAATAIPPGPGAEDFVRRRRDLAVEGYLGWRARVEDEGPAALAELHELAAKLVRGKASGWQNLWRERPLAEARRTGEHLDALAEADPAHLSQASVHAAPAHAGPLRYGMCGHLQTFDVEGAQPAR